MSYYINSCRTVIFLLHHSFQLLADIVLFERSPSPTFVSITIELCFSNSIHYTTTIILFDTQRVPDLSSGSPFSWCLLTCSYQSLSTHLLCGTRCSRLDSHVTLVPGLVSGVSPRSPHSFWLGIDFRNQNLEASCVYFFWAFSVGKVKKYIKIKFKLNPFPHCIPSPT